VYITTQQNSCIAEKIPLREPTMAFGVAGATLAGVTAA